jgi:hypothetical protein
MARLDRIRSLVQGRIRRRGWRERRERALAGIVGGLHEPTVADEITWMIVAHVQDQAGHPQDGPNPDA